MNANCKTEKTYSITDITEDQARDLLYFAAKIENGEDIPYNGRQLETLDSLRQSLMSTGLTVPQRPSE